MNIARLIIDILYNHCWDKIFAVCLATNFVFSTSTYIH